MPRDARQKLTPAHIALLKERRAAGATHRELAREFGVNEATIGRHLGTRKRAPTVTSSGGPAPTRTPGMPAGMVLPPVPPIDVLSPELFDTGALVRELVDRGGLHEFLRQFWSTIVPSPFLDNWHIGAMCESLEAVTLGQIKRLAINVPPATGKTGLVNIVWPAWQWTLKPETKFLCASFDQSLVLDAADKMLSIITSELYQSAYPYVELTSHAPARGNFTNTAGGLRFSTTPEGKATGRHAHIAIVDDPMKPQDAINQRKASFQKIDTWFDGTLPTRAVDPKNFAIVLIMQRLHADDLAGKCLSKGYESLILPMRRTKRVQWARDPRKEPGELLWPERYPEEKVRELEIQLRSEASAQLQQDPTPPTGGFIEEPWTRLEWIEPPKRGTWVQSWDFSAKGELESHSKVSGQLWCKTRELGLVHQYISDLNDRLAKITGANLDRIIKRLPEKGEWYCLIDWVGGHWNFVASRAQFAMAQQRPMWANARIKLLEGKANGLPLYEEFRKTYTGLKLVEPDGTKEERLRVHTPLWEAGQIIYAPGSDAVREEHIKFPRFTWDDHVDTTTQALDRLTNGAMAYRENLAKIAAGGAMRF